jgi:peptidoglycan/xylan/chitin deacetylase (PgdA/CDA1 family)
VLNYEEGSETTPVNGDSESCAICSELGPGAEPFKGKRNVNIESLYEYGSRAGVWRILRLLKEYDIRCTSWAVGQALEYNPDVARAMVRDGHEVASHGWRWVDRSVWSEEEEHENVLKTIKGEPVASLYSAGQEPTYHSHQGPHWSGAARLVLRQRPMRSRRAVPCPHRQGIQRRRRGSKVLVR